MAPTGDPGTGVAIDQANARQLNDELRDIDERLRDMVEVYQENPSTIDSCVLNITNRAVDVKSTITEAYRIMKTRVYTDDSPLQAENEVWEAFEEQKDEFIVFYRSALKVLEIYREVLLAYNIVQCEVGPELQRGDIERIRQDKRAQVEERDGCIDAVSDFHGKFSAMITFLYAGDSRPGAR